MHMSDALLSPVVGAAMWAATAGTLGICSNRVRQEADDFKVPLMGVAGAFVFAAQMITFTIPGTGSSGHLGGGLLLAILLGPHAAFLAMASVLTVQALFFADGGLLALGCNIFNLGFFPCLIAYPVIFRPIAGNSLNPARRHAGIILAAMAGLQLGALGVVLETTLSDLAALPFSSFILMMLPIHLAIGITEGLVTAAVVSFLVKTMPEILTGRETATPSGNIPLRKVLATLAIAAALTGGILSWFASRNPDGLEWSIAKVAGSAEVSTAEQSIPAFLRRMQKVTAFLPDYGFRKNTEAKAILPGRQTTPAEPGPVGAHANPFDPGTSISGLTGGLITCLVAAMLGFTLKRRSPR